MNNIILKEKYKTQKRFDKLAKHNLSNYFLIIDKKVHEMEKKYKFKVNYKNIM